MPPPLDRRFEPTAPDRFEPAAESSRAGEQLWPPAPQESPTGSGDVRWPAVPEDDRLWPADDAPAAPAPTGPEPAQTGPEPSRAEAALGGTGPAPGRVRPAADRTVPPGRRHRADAAVDRTETPGPEWRRVAEGRRAGEAEPGRHALRSKVARRAVILGAIVVAAVLIWHYVFPVLDRLLPENY